MSFFSAVIDSMSAYNEKRARELVAHELSNMPARELADLGFDSVLIAKGAKGWPWRVESNDELSELKVVWESESNAIARRSSGEVASHAELNDEKDNRVQVAQAA